jgi:AAHS family 4-hydroxybenzoate transporter-like MFS transporter
MKLVKVTQVNNTAVASLSGYSRVAAGMVVAIAFVLAMVDGYDMFIMSFVAPLVAHDLHLTPSRMGALFSAGLFGSMLGGLALGPIADRLGRQPVLLASLAAAGAATFLCSQAQSFESFAALRFAAGFALGGVLAAVVPLVAECFPSERRSGAVTSMFIGYPLGAVVGGAITSMLLGHGWRPLFWGTGLLTLLVVPAALLFRETLGAPAAQEPGDTATTTGLPLLELFREGRFWVTTITALGIFCLLLLTYLLNSWTPTIAVKAGFTPATAALSGVFLNLGGVVGALLSIPAARRFGVFKVAALMIGIGSPAIAALGHLFAAPGILFGGLFLAGLLVIGGQQNSPAMAVLLYPQRMRAAGAGLQFAVGRLGSILGPLIGGYLLATNHTPHSLFLLMAAPAVLAAICYAVVHRLRAR